MQRRLLYIINPISGRRNKQTLEELIQTETKKAGFYFEIFPSVSSGDYSFLDDLIKTKKITHIVVAGGDGTVNQAINSLKKHHLPFAIIPCGSGNGLAFSAGIPKNSAYALNIAFTGKSEWTDAFTINDQFACMLCGLGFDGKVAHEFSEQPKRGLRTYASLVGKNFFTAKPYHFQLESNGIKFSTEAFFVSIANSNQFGNNFTIAPKALLSDGLLDVVIVKKIAKPLLLVSILKQVLAGRLKKIENSLQQPVIYFQTQELKIINTDQALLHIDGDPAETPQELNIKILKKCFRLISPA